LGGRHEGCWGAVGLAGGEFSRAKKIMEKVQTIVHVLREQHIVTEEKKVNMLGLRFTLS